MTKEMMAKAASKEMSGATKSASALGREMTGAEMVIEVLADQGVKHIFGYPGGAVLPIYDAIFQQKKVEHILDRKSTRLNSSHIQKSRMPSSA